MAGRYVCLLVYYPKRAWWLRLSRCFGGVFYLFFPTAVWPWTNSADHLQLMLSMYNYITHTAYYSHKIYPLLPGDSTRNQMKKATVASQLDSYWWAWNFFVFLNCWLPTWLKKNSGPLQLLKSQCLFSPPTGFPHNTLIHSNKQS